MLPGQKSKKATPKSHRDTKPLQVGGGEIVPAITVDKSGNTAIDPGAVGGFTNSSKVRGRSPRPANLQRIPDDTAIHHKSSSSSSP